MNDPLVRPYSSVWTLDLRGLRTAVDSGIISIDGGVDLSQVGFVTPGGMTGLSCLLETWAAEQGRVPLVPPEDEVAGYMARMDFFELLDGLISPSRSLSHLGNRGRYPASLSELRKVSNSRDVTHVIGRFHNILYEGGLQEDEVRHCCDVLSKRAGACGVTVWRLHRHTEVGQA